MCPMASVVSLDQRLDDLATRQHAQLMLYTYRLVHLFSYNCILKKILDFICSYIKDLLYYFRRDLCEGH